MKRNVIIIICVAVLLALVGYFVATSSDDEPIARYSEETEDDTWLDEEFGFEEQDNLPPADGDMRGPGKRWERRANETPEQREARREERRARRRARMEAMSPEERAAFRDRRRQRFVSRVNITAHGTAESNLTAEILHEEIRPARRATRDCVRGLGDVYRDWRRSATGGDAGASRSMSFEVSADGLVDAQSMQLSPPAPGAILDCFVSSYQNLELTAPGEEDVTVEIELPNRRRRPPGPPPEGPPPEGPPPKGPPPPQGGGTSTP